MGGSRRAAEAIRRQARDTAERQPRVRYATVRDTNPLVAELVDANLVLEEEDVEMGHGARRFESDHGIEAGDTLCVTYTGRGRWLAVEVLSETDPYPVSAFAKTLLDDPDAATARQTLAIPTSLVAHAPQHERGGSDPIDDIDFGTAGRMAVARPASLPATPLTTELVKDPTPGGGLLLWDALTSQWIPQGSGKAVPVFSAYHNTTQTINATDTKVLFNTEERDPTDCFASSRWTPNRPGYYRLSTAVSPNVNDKALRVWIYKNGARHKQLVGMPRVASQSGTGGSSCEVYANGNGDYFEVYAFLDPSGGDLYGEASTARYTWFDGEFISNDYAGGVVTPAFRAKRTSVAAGLTDRASALLFNSEDFDDGDCYDPATGQHTAKVAGKYHFHSQVQIDGTNPASQRFGLVLYKNGAEISWGEQRDGMNSANVDNLHVEDTLKLAAGDVIEVRLYFTGGGSEAIFGQAGASAYSHFSGFFIPEPAGVLVPEAWHVVGAAGEPGFTNGWVNSGGGTATVAFMKDPFGVVRLRGGMKDGTMATTAFTLPPGYRPVAIQRFGGSHGYIYVDQTGIVQAATGTNAVQSLDDISFRIS